MTNYEKVFEEAIGNYGLITSAQAVGIGVSNKELVKLASRGRLTRIGQGDEAGTGPGGEGRGRRPPLPRPSAQTLRNRKVFVRLSQGLPRPELP